MESHTFLDIPIRGSLLGNRAGVASIMIGSLLYSLRAHLVDQSNPTSPKIYTILNGDLQQYNITVSTTRVPNFGTECQNPIYGYRSLGPLSSILCRLDYPSPLMDPYREILSIHSIDGNPLTAEFARVWAPMNIQLASHFIILLISPFSDRSRGASPAVYRRTAPSRGSSSGYLSPSPFLGFPSWPLLHSRSNSGSSQSSPSIFSRELPYHTSSPSLDQIADMDRHLSPPSINDSDPLNTHQLVPGLAMTRICQIVGISDKLIEDARCKQKQGSLAAMVYNHNAMCLVLTSLGLSTSKSEIEVPKYYSGGLTLKPSEVLNDPLFGWAPLTFVHKFVWYSWAANTAKKVWKPDHTIPIGNPIYMA
jgi:hypothetical protein